MAATPRHLEQAGTTRLLLSAKASASRQRPHADGDAEGSAGPLGFKDSAFADDVAKTDLAAILSQHGLGDVRSL